MAQWASTRPDVFPPRLIDKIVCLQDDVKVSHSLATVEHTLEEAFGPDWKNQLDLDPNPLGAGYNSSNEQPLITLMLLFYLGSVAQVFKGTLKPSNSTQQKAVAIKMIHPHVESMVKTDMELLSYIASMMDKVPSLEILSLGETMRQFADAMNNQLDLRLEARNLIKFTKKFSNDSWALFPSPIEGFVTKNVLVESLMEGVPIANFMQLKSEIGDGIHQLKMKLSDLGCRLILKMVFFDNFIHGDLHPGYSMKYSYICCIMS
jgi:aarF domain-containing kinase